MATPKRGVAHRNRPHRCHMCKFYKSVGNAKRRFKARDLRRLQEV